MAVDRAIHTNLQDSQQRGGKGIERPSMKAKDAHLHAELSPSGFHLTTGKINGWYQHDQ